MTTSAEKGREFLAVKICGCRTEADVETAEEAGAAWIGLVFHPPSPRHLSPERAAALAAAAGRARPVGVFVDASPEEVTEAAGQVGLAAAQLHGRESPEACEAVRARGLTVWKALRPRTRSELVEGVRRYAGSVDALLVEGFSPARAGGTRTGLPYGWLRDWPPDGAGDGPVPPLILAGGLTPRNVVEAVRHIRPSAVDVSSGVERSPGEKDPILVRRFVRRALEAAEKAARRGAG